MATRGAEAASAEFTGLLASVRSDSQRTTAWIVFGIAPFIALLLSWVPEGALPTNLQFFIKALSIPTLIAEVAIIALGLNLCFACGKTLEVPRTLRIGGLVFLTIVLGTAFFASVDAGTSLFRSMIFLVHILFAWSVALHVRHLALRPRTLINALAAGFLLSSAGLALYMVQIDDPAAFDWMHDLPGYDNIRRLAYYTAPIVALCLARCSAERGKRMQALWISIALLGWALLFWNGGRGAIASVLAASLIGAALFPSFRSWRFWGTLIGTAAAGAFVAWSVGSPSKYMGMGRIANVTPDHAVPDPASGFSSGRFSLWRETIAQVGERPLFGHGDAQLWYLVPKLQDINVYHPHNVLLQWLLAWGIVGTLILLLLAAPLVRKAVQNVRQAPAELSAPFLMALTLAVYSLVDGTLFHVQATAIFAACAGLLLGWKKW